MSEHSVSLLAKIRHIHGLHQHQLLIAENSGFTWCPDQGHCKPSYSVPISVTDSDDPGVTLMLTWRCAGCRRRSKGSEQARFKEGKQEYGRGHTNSQRNLCQDGEHGCGLQPGGRAAAEKGQLLGGKGWPSPSLNGRPVHRH